MGALHLSILLLKSWSPDSFYSHLDDGEPDVSINIHPIMMSKVALSHKKLLYGQKIWRIGLQYQLTDFNLVGLLL